MCPCSSSLSQPPGLVVHSTVERLPNRQRRIEGTARERTPEGSLLVVPLLACAAGAERMSVEMLSLFGSFDRVAFCFFGVVETVETSRSSFSSVTSSSRCLWRVREVHPAVVSFFSFAPSTRIRCAEGGAGFLLSRKHIFLLIQKSQFSYSTENPSSSCADTWRRRPVLKSRQTHTRRVSAPVPIDVALVSSIRTNTMRVVIHQRFMRCATTTTNMKVVGGRCCHCCCP